jgi:phosphoribosyl-ATP pyrophosphohydrolase/phosphoribosyl-AMP cyclohydrolase
LIVSEVEQGTLTPVVVQHAITGQVLMLAYTNAELLERTAREGRVWFWSRSRGGPWLKGATSGNYLNVQSITMDCDQDAVLVEVTPEGPACHTGKTSCFHRPVMGSASPGILLNLGGVIESRVMKKPEGSYTAALAGKGPEAILRKVSEEAFEVVLAAKEEGAPGLVWEVADLWYHCMVLLSVLGYKAEDVLEELARRAKRDEQG